jgi:hypothetical protein
MKYRSRRKQRADLLGWILLVGVGGIVALVLWLYFKVGSAKPTIDQVTNCPTDGPRSLTVVLLDATDSLDVVQRTDILERLEDIKDKVPRYGELELFTVVPAGDHLLEAKFAACNPGHGAEINQVYENKTMVERRWKDQFSNKMNDTLTPLLGGRPADTSPILESIQQAAIQSFAEPKAETIPKQLVIVSDMIQNTAEFSQYSPIMPFERFKDTRYYLKVRADLPDVDVTILLLNRPQNGLGRGAALIKFWKQYFNDAGVEALNIHRVEG